MKLLTNGMAVVLLFVVCAVEPVMAQGEQFKAVSEWLDRMAHIGREQSYQGTFVYIAGMDMETLSITHLVKDGEVRERVVALSGPVKETRPAAARGVSDTPSGEAALLSDSVFPQISPQALRRARRAYFFRLDGDDRVAGLSAQKISIIPRDRFRFGYELWLERETGLILRWELLDTNRRPLAKLMFTELRIGDALDLQRLEQELRDEKLVSRSLEATVSARDSLASEQGIRFRGLPPSFSLTGRAHANALDQTGAEHLVFSDGLVSVSVYLEPVTESQGRRQGLSRMGTTSAWSRQQGDVQVTTVGEVPPATLKRIGQSMLNEAAQRQRR